MLLQVYAYKMRANKHHIERYILLTMCLLSVSFMRAEELGYRMEAGVQGGLGYYVGDAVKHIFMYPRAVAGAQFRYKITSRWAVQLKGQWAEIAFPTYGTTNGSLSKLGMVNLDAVAEFNFFRFGAKQYDDRIKPITPYIFIGIGGSIFDDYQRLGAYIPLGFGLKWKFARHWGLNVQWQQQIFLSDDVDGGGNYGNTYNLNGSNILNNDLTSTLTVGIVFEFFKERAVCPMCGD